MSKDLPREKRIYLAIWRKVWREQLEQLHIKMPSYNLAMTVRMSMYRTIQPYREGALHDDELKMASEKYILALQKEPPAIIVALRKTAEVADLIFADLGLDEADLMTEEELSSLRAVEAISEGMAAPLTNENPFYTRED